MQKIQISKNAKPLLQEAHRYKIMYGGRGGGKSHDIARALIMLGMSKPLFIVCGREIQKSIEHSVYRLLCNLITDYNLSYFYTIQKSKIIGKNGTEFVFTGLKHNPEGIKSLEGADICWIEEAENVSNGSWEILIPTIRKPNSEIWISFNPKNPTDPTWTRFCAEPSNDTWIKKVNWRDNPWFPDVLKTEMEKLKKADFDAYLHVWEGEFDTRFTGYIYAKQMQAAQDENRICNVPCELKGEVITAWDLGYGDSTAIWFAQIIGKEVRIIDHYENYGEEIAHYVQVIKQKGYNYAKEGHYLPHDANNGQLGTGQSIAAQLREMGVQNKVLPRDDVNSGIELVRQLIPKCWFDRDKTKDGRHALTNYQFEYDEKRETFKKSPLHDWSSHSADAFRYLAMAIDKHHSSAPIKPVKVVPTNYGSSGWMM